MPQDNDIWQGKEGLYKKGILLDDGERQFVVNLNLCGLTKDVR